MSMGIQAISGEALDRVRDYVRVGRFAEARTLLADFGDPEALLERAWIAFYHDGNPQLANELIRRCLAADPTPGEDLRARALRAVVSANRGEEAERFDVADFAGVEPEAVSHVVYFIASAAYMRDDFAGARAWISQHTPTTPAMRARFLVLRGFIAAANEDFEGQAQLAADAIELLLSEAPGERYLLATIAQTLAYLVRELAFHDGVELLERLNDTLEWNDGIAHARFQVLRALGWARALDGDHRESLRLITRAASAAPSDILRVYAHLDHASIAIFADQRLSARAAFDLADEYARSIDWERVGRDNIAALPLAAQVAAELGANAEARNYCDLALRHQANIDRHFSLARGSRLRAFIGEAIALTYAEEAPERAIEEAGASYEVLARINFPWRAARMALLLHHLTRKMMWKDRATDHLALYPNSPYRRLIHTTGLTLRPLTLRQTQVLDLVRLGYSDAQIGDELGISMNTVRIHVGKLLRFYRARNRTELARKASA